MVTVALAAAVLVTAPSGSMPSALAVKVTAP
jgi:hypothetical protein